MLSYFTVYLFQTSQKRIRRVTGDEAVGCRTTYTAHAAEKLIARITTKINRLGESYGIIERGLSLNRHKCYAHVVG